MIEDVQISGIGGWQEFQFSQAINEPAASFTLQSSKGPANESPANLRQGEITVTANGELLLTGYVDRYTANGDPGGGRTVSISGRSKTADIIDSQTFGTFRKQNGKQIIEKLISPYGVGLETDIADWNDHEQFVVESGSTVMRAIYNVLQLQQASAAVSNTGQLQIWNSDNIGSIGSAGIGGGELSGFG